jgi:hypothetical protein
LDWTGGERSVAIAKQHLKFKSRRASSGCRNVELSIAIEIANDKRSRERSRWECY